jgi:hypothetical protein
MKHTGILHPLGAFDALNGLLGLFPAHFQFGTLGDQREQHLHDLQQD